MKIKKIPMRTCCVTKEKYPKNELIRVVKNNLGEVNVDITGKQNGRGAYLKKDLLVIEKARKTKCLDRFLETEINDNVYKELEDIISNN